MLLFISLVHHPQSLALDARLSKVSEERKVELRVRGVVGWGGGRRDLSCLGQ